MMTSHKAAKKSEITKAAMAQDGKIVEETIMGKTDMKIIIPSVAIIKDRKMWLRFAIVFLIQNKSPVRGWAEVLQDGFFLVDRIVKSFINIGSHASIRSSSPLPKISSVAVSTNRM